MSERSAPWHPIFLCEEPTPGVWEMTADNSPDGPFARIEIRRVSAGIRYRVEVHGQLIGWATSLQVATEQAYVGWLHAARSRRQLAAYG